jgi:hypothetical protein
LPQTWARTVKGLSGWREGQIIGLLGREFTEAIEGAGWPVDFAHGFQQQILQGGVKVLSHEHPVAGSKQVNVRIGEVAAKVEEASP